MLDTLQEIPVQDTLTQKEFSIPEAYQFRRQIYTFRRNREELDRWIAEQGKPRDAEKLGRYGQALWTVGRPREAAEALKGAPKSPLHQYLLARAFLDLGDWEEALAAVKKAGGAKSETPEIQWATVEAMAQAGQAEEALKELVALRSQHDQKGEFHYLLGLCHEKLHQPEKALEEYERAVQFEPEHVKALFRLAVLYDLYGEDQRSLETYEKCCSLNPAHVNALINLGLTYEDMGEYERAIECYKLILRADPNHDRAILFVKDALASTTMYYDEELRKEQERRRQLLGTPVTEFELSVRARKCLEKMHVVTLVDLVQKSELELLSYKNFGETSLREIKELLQTRGLQLGQKPEPKAVSWEDIVRTPEKDLSQELLSRPISDLKLSVRSARCMARLRVHTIGDLAAKTIEELLEVRNFGRTSMMEVLQRLQEAGIILKEKKEVV